MAGELRGVRTHGVANLAPRYLAWVEEGFANPTPRWSVARGARAAINVDGDRGLGIVVAAQVMDDLVERARDTGIAFATVHGSRHLGMAGFHALRAVEHGMIGVCTTSVRARMVPTFGREPRLGTNPIAVAVPTGEEPPFLFDAATTTVASNKLRLAANAGATVPPGLMVDVDGTPVREPAVPAEPFRLTPLGGTPEASSYKGYGLAMVVDVLGVVLSQASFGARFAPGEAGHCLVAIDVDTLLPVDDFRAAMDDYVRTLAATPTAPGQDQVRVAGRRSHDLAVAHARDGVPLPERAIDWIEATASRLGVEVPDLAPVPATGSATQQR